jgi:methylmalonyl-CoA mutase C-terminal domain/subunit
MERVKEEGLTDKLVLVGGNIPRRDIKTLKEYGVSGVFGTGADLDDIVKFIREKCRGEK